MPLSWAGWFRPSSRPRPLRFADTAERVLARLEVGDDARADQVLALAEAAYGEASERADSADRRAATIQGAIAITASLTVAGGSLLLDGNKVPSGTWTWILGATLVALVMTLVVAAWRALLVTRPQYMWASPAFEEVYELSQAEHEFEMKAQRAADLFVAYGRNDRIAALKIQLLGSAVRWLVAALLLIGTMAALMVVLAIDRQSSKTPLSPVSSTAQPSPAVGCPPCSLLR
jgi:hypothetical protein